MWRCAAGAMVGFGFAVPCLWAQMHQFDFNELSLGGLPQEVYFNSGISAIRLVDLTAGPGADGRVSIVSAEPTYPPPAIGRGLRPFTTLAGHIGDFEFLLHPRADYFSIHAFDGPQAMEAIAFLGNEQVAQLSIPAEPGRMHIHIQLGEIGGTMLFDRVRINVSPGIYSFDPEAGPSFFDVLTINAPTASRITDLGSFPNQGISMAWGISGDGQLAVGSIATHPGFSWNLSDGLAPLAVLPGHSTAWAISASADGSTIVGWSASTASGSGRAVRWTNGVIEDLGATTSSAAYGVSADGTVVAGGRMVGGKSRAAVWTPGGMVDLGTLPGGEESIAYGISADGNVVVGWSDTATGRHLFRWSQATGMVDLGVPPQGYWMPSSVADLAVSADGSTIVGTCSIAGIGRPVRWTGAGGFEELDRLPGEPAGSVWDVSADGSVIVGSVGAGPSLIGKAVMWKDGAVIDLNTLLDAADGGWTLWTATGVSADGTMAVGIGSRWGRVGSWLAHLSAPFCYANCDGSTTEPLLTVDDFTCFINEFAFAMTLTPQNQMTAYANCDGSTTEPILTVDDFTCFINAFAAGCP